jgi:hypothetical protein
MTIKKPSSKGFEKARAEQLEYNAKREKGYRERAIKIYPWTGERSSEVWI